MSTNQGSESNAQGARGSAGAQVFLPLVTIVGRPNVGKSTLFNRLVGERRSIVGDEPGITRDRIYGEAEWAGRRFKVVDTGGIVPDDEAIIPANILKQAETAIQDAVALVWVVDARAGLTPLDEELARLLRSTGKPVLVAANKTDAVRFEAHAGEFYRFGFEGVYPLAAEQGDGVGDLLDALVERFDASARVVEDADKDAPREIRLAIIGRPNVGKSSLLNRLLGEERVIVSPLAGTTRDAVDTVLDWPLEDASDEAGTARVEATGASAGTDAEVETSNLETSNLESLEAMPGDLHVEPEISNSTSESSDSESAESASDLARAESASPRVQRFRLIDTAGIRRKGKTGEMAEKLSVVMARRSLERADVAVVVVDAVEGVTALDAHIAGYALEAGCSIIIAVNKWDALPNKETGTPFEFERNLRDKMKFLDWAPVVTISALTGQRVERLLPLAIHANRARNTRISTSQLNDFFERAIDAPRAPSAISPVKGGRSRLRVQYVTQVGVRPPTFIVFTSGGAAGKNSGLHFSYERYLQNRLREEFDFFATPLRIVERHKREKGGGRKGGRAK
ncbi:MAG TPA: ribosome biogenesis GTPase Der [Pyrinomonadaceae bacterium]|nr:ribosome biogenesis GTPase Der [Pyrinomonadaceae bacterium]